MGRRVAVSSSAAVAAAALLLSGCGSSSSSGSGSPQAGSGPCGTDQPTTLTVGLFGTFGFKENGLWDEYKKTCPNITVTEDVVEQSAD
jgi:cellobiose transport system substrate-binding protein